MSSREAERRRRQRQLEERQRALDNDPNAILTFREWCRLNRLSERNGRRIIGSPDGPVVTQLSARRIGISRANNERWQRSRERGARSEMPSIAE